MSPPRFLRARNRAALVTTPPEPVWIEPVPPPVPAFLAFPFAPRVPWWRRAWRSFLDLFAA